MQTLWVIFIIKMQGASSIHEDELSGQLQQKENHINELHGNLEEVQVSNKLDGASFR